jgi:outer membrane protein OmpA-like peptidoglycan-associated protein
VAQGYSQDRCSPSESKKALKLLEKAKSSGLSLREREEILLKSLEEDSECLECRYALARTQYQIASEQNRSYDRALKNFEKIITQCSTYSPDPYYYAGIIEYGNQAYGNSLEYFEKFLSLEVDPRKVSRDYQKKVDDVSIVLPEIRFYSDFYENPVPYNPQKVEGIASRADEYLPMLSPDNSLIFFTRKEMIKNKGDLYAREVERFMQAQKEGDDYKDPSALPPPFNVGDNYGGVSISLDNREMFVTVCKQVNSSYKNCDIYVTRFEHYTDPAGNDKMKWTGLENLGPAINTEGGWEAQPTLSADGNTLYFATIRENTTPDKEGNPTTDIFQSERNADGSWSQAKPLGKPINTAGNDKSPFLHVDSKTLYYASNGRMGAGGYDIYYSRQNADGSWSDPKNLGYPINSSQDEHGLIVSTDGARAYFASSNIQSAQGLDIFNFEVPQKAKPEKVLILKGDVRDDTGKIVEDAKIELKYTKSKEAKEVDVDKQDGSYAAVINLRKDDDVVVSVKSESVDLGFNTRLFTIEDTAMAVQEINMEVSEVEEGKAYKMNDIRFATNSSDIDESSKRVLDEFADYLKEHPSFHIEIGGHTDNVGDPEKNLVLSTDRAFEVFGYMQEHGVSAERMTFKGYGQTKPVAPNDTPENRAKNRRTEFTISRR